MDLVEANTKAFQITPHKCNSKNGAGIWQDCDRGGCFKRVHEGNNYGWGSQFTINTQNTFSVSFTFVATNGRFSSMVSKLTQGGNSVTINHGSDCGSGYLDAMTDMLKEMTFAISYWGSDAGSMSWLDGPQCGNTNCAKSGAVTFSNIQVSGGSTTPTTPKATPTPPKATPTPPKATPSATNCPTYAAQQTNNYYFQIWSTQAVTVSCKNGVSGPCTKSLWNDNIYECRPQGECPSPRQVKIGGKTCPLDGVTFAQDAATALEVTTPTTESSSNEESIPGYAIGLIVLATLMVLVLIVIIALLITRNNNNTERV